MHKKNNQIQVLRGIFCILIVIYHLFFRFSEIYSIESIFYNSFFSKMGLFGVTAFFIISGVYLVSNSKVYVGIKNINLLYYGKRILFIWTIYVVAITIIFVISLFNKDTGRTVSFTTYLQNIFFVNLLTGSNYVDGAHWYIVTLIIIIIWTLVLSIFGKQKDKWVWMFILIINIIVGVFSIVFRTNKYISILYFLMGSQYFPIVVIGVSIKGYIDADKIYKNNLIYLVNCAVSSIYLYFINWLYPVFFAIIIPLIILALSNKLPFLDNFKILTLIGNASFSIYLIHQNIGYFIIYYLYQFTNIYLSTIVGFIAVVISGLLFYLCIEKNIKKIFNYINLNKLS